MEKVRVSTYCKSQIDEDLRFPTVNYLDTQKSIITLTPFQKVLKTELLATKDCVVYHCTTKGCKVKSTFHPLCIKEMIAGCNRCDKIQTIVERILKSKGYKLIELSLREDRQYLVKFLCDKQHIWQMYYDDLRRGKSCVTCDKEKNARKKAQKIQRQDCECKHLGLCFRTDRYSRGNICEHYNFAVALPDAALEWDYCLNDILPNRVAPNSHKKYWFECFECHEFYEQRLDNRKISGCPYCEGRKVSKTNNLLVTHPEIASQWDLDNNFLYPNEVTRGSHEEVQWICKETSNKHTYMRMIALRTGNKNVGCYCKDAGYNQRKGKHEYFVKVSSIVHNNKYSYPEKYIDIKTKINIHCPIISEYDNMIHGNFLQTPGQHKKGGGCPKCLKDEKDSKGVVKIKNILTSLGYTEDVDYICEKKFPGMKYVGPLRLDFFLKTPYCSIAIEFDGIQHFSIGSHWGQKESMEKRHKKDICKDVYCLKNKISMLRFPYNCDITEDYIKRIIELCSKRQTYMSYTHLINSTKQEIDLSDIIVLENKNFE